MAVKLHRCANQWVKFGAHPCWRVQKALDDMGVEYERRAGPVADGKREAISSGTGQKHYPAIEFEDGTWYREESKDMAKTIRAGKLLGARERRPEPPAKLCPTRGYSSAGRAPGSHPGGRRFEPA